MKKDSYYYWYVDKCGGKWGYYRNQINLFLEKIKVKLSPNKLDKLIYDVTTESDSYRILSVMRLPDKVEFFSGQTVKIKFNSGKEYFRRIDYFFVNKDGTIMVEFERSIKGYRYPSKTGLNNLIPIY